MSAVQAEGLQDVGVRRGRRGVLADVAGEMGGGFEPAEGFGIADLAQQAQQVQRGGRVVAVRRQAGGSAGTVHTEQLAHPGPEMLVVAHVAAGRQERLEQPEPLERGSGCNRRCQAAVRACVLGQRPGAPG
ncbi:hypothetical protein, partial [Kitasatospora sp. NPDC093558]|uniref:hypothetical protein n=1 Tax=Kitasatospora sp. NPDC093558 TaxID=3155201 RepID=UPI003439068E